MFATMRRRPAQYSPPPDFTSEIESVCELSSQNSMFSGSSAGGFRLPGLLKFWFRCVGRLLDDESFVAVVGLLCGTLDLALTAAGRQSG